MDLDQIVLLLFTLFIGSILGALALRISVYFKKKSFQHLGQEIVQKSEIEAESIIRTAELNAKQHLLEKQRELEILWQNERKKIQKEEERLKVREDKIESRLNLVEKKLTDIEKREAILAMRKIQNDEERKEIQELKKHLLLQLETSSGLSSLEAKEMLLNKLTLEVKSETANLIRKITKEAEEEAEKKAAAIIATSINRLAASCASEATVSTVTIPEEMKGRIIGREGRNIRTLERLTGVNFIIDDTPGAIVLSGFDPIRKQIAKLTILELITDGRIHPSRIEEVVDKTTLNVQKQIKQFGEDAALRAGAINLHTELIYLLGKLKFRFSYGQNVLDHSLEVSCLMGMMAAELGLDQQLAKTIGLLHDIGKAVSHEVEGSHAIIGHDLALKYGLPKVVANGIGCHHFEMEALSIEASLCAAADTISASRPGARVEAIEEYIKRLKKLEEIAYSFPGIEKAYAMQAGREVLVFVMPESIDDDGTLTLARDLTKKIEQDLSYPGRIKVTIIREKRIVAYAA